MPIVIQPSLDRLLVDAIESGIVKIPRLPVSDTTGRPDPKYFKLWQSITAGLQPGEKLPGGKPKPEVVWREAEDALATLASQYKERFQIVQGATPGGAALARCGEHLGPTRSLGIPRLHGSTAAPDRARADCETPLGITTTRYEPNNALRTRTLA